jgi:peptidoglycan/LPS O-acetylase OafA/YrhL
MAQGLSALAAWLLVVHVIAAACHKYIEMPAQTRIRAWWKNLA